MTSIKYIVSRTECKEKCDMGVKGFKLSHWSWRLSFLFNDQK